MKPRILLIDMPLRDAAEEIFHTGARLRAYPFLQTQADQHEAMLPLLATLTQEELDIVRALMEAGARIGVVDDGIDDLSGSISGTLLVENGNDRSAPVFQRYYGNVPPSRFRRPVLGEQLATMRTWVPSLLQSSPALQAYGAQLAERVADADAAVLAAAEAERRLADWELGPRKQFIDQLNGLRQAHYGQIAELPYNRPELGLPRDFAHRFFLRTTAPRRPTIPVLQQSIARQRTQLEKAEQQLARMIEESEAEARMREDGELADAAEELAAIEAQRADAAARLAEIQARRNPSSN